ncbi:MAG: Rhomboid protease GlpG [Chlamydiae bacterium]|nr:Rhomboid protease GlpG [Chlamydiota bacterium]
MRLIGFLKTEEETQKLSHLFNRKGIEHSYEFRPAQEKENSRFDIWIVDENDFDEAKDLFEAFQKNPEDKKLDIPKDLEEKSTSSQSLFETPPISPKGLSVKEPKAKKSKVTFFFLLVCAVLFVIQQIQVGSIFRSERGKNANIVILTPLMQWTLFDFPPIFNLIVGFQDQFQISPFDQTKDWSKEEKDLKDQIENGSYFEGYYTILQAYFQKDTSVPLSYPHFYKIRQGQVWRFFTPILLHGGFLHLLFNMLWLLVLGLPVERRIGSKRFLFLILIAAFLSNTAQYVISGPLFLGFSGVITAFAGYIYSRKKKAPWEGYPIQRSILIFFLIYVLFLLLVQFGGFVLSIVNPTILRVPLPIANSAHIVGGLVGILLGRFKFFAWKPKL